MLRSPRSPAAMSSAPSSPRELAGTPRLIIVANPCFGLDFQPVAEIHSQIVTAPNRGAAILLVSDDFDEILEIADCIFVMSEGRIVYGVPTEAADRHVVGSHMTGRH